MFLTRKATKHYIPVTIPKNGEQKFKNFAEDHLGPQKIMNFFIIIIHKILR